MAREDERPGELAALVALLRSGQRSPAHYADLLDETGSAQLTLEQEQGLLAADLMRAAANEIAGWKKLGMHLVTVLDPDYPENLRAVHDRPPLLFLAGQLKAGDERAVAVIGSRRASAAGIERAQALTRELVAGGYVIVSGLAAGIDTTAHTTALGQDGRTAAVIGTGLSHCYPAQNAPLQRQIADQGAVISQFWPDARPSRETFPLRNATMSGLALATVIVEAGQTSGARIQARQALSHGRPVLLAEAILDQEWGRNLAERPGVHVIRSTAEVVGIVDRLASTDAPVA